MKTAAGSVSEGVSIAEAVMVAGAAGDEVEEEAELGRGSDHEGGGLNAPGVEAVLEAICVALGGAGAGAAAATWFRGLRDECRSLIRLGGSGVEGHRRPRL